MIQTRCLLPLCFLAFISLLLCSCQSPMADPRVVIEMKEVTVLVPQTVEVPVTVIVLQTVEVPVTILVEASPRPTYTPYLPATPYPTYTLYPTYIPLPTYTRGATVQSEAHPAKPALTPSLRTPTPKTDRAERQYLSVAFILCKEIFKCLSALDQMKPTTALATVLAETGHIEAIRTSLEATMPPSGLVHIQRLLLDACDYVQQSFENVWQGDPAQERLDRAYEKNVEAERLLKELGAE